MRGELVLEAIRKAEGVEPTEEGVNDVVARYASQSGQEAEAFRQSLTEEQMRYITEDAATIAVLDLLKKEAKKAG